MAIESCYLEKDPPSIVYVSEKKTVDLGWGFVQFPKLNRISNSRLLLTFQVAEDTANSYGKDGFKYFTSDDNGKTWEEIKDKKKEQLKSLSGLMLDNGSIISVETPKTKKIQDLNLPSEPFTWLPYDYTYSHINKGYRFDELPNSLQAIKIRSYTTEKDMVAIHNSKITLIDDFRISSEDLLPVIFFGPLLKMNNSVIGVFYPSYTYKDNAIDIKDGILLVKSEDQGQTWQEWDRLPYQPDLSYDPKANMRGGFTEPSAIFLDDGSLLIALRTADATPEPYPGFTEAGPLYTVKRSLKGKWSKPKPISPYGVLPQLLKLKNNMLLLSYGRPGVQIRISQDNGKNWSKPYDILESTRLNPRQETCGYTSIVEDPNNPNAFLIAFSDFLFETSNHTHHKAIIVQRCEIKGPYQLPVAPEDSNETPDRILDQHYPEMDHALSARIRFKNNQLSGNSEGFYETGKVSFITPYLEGKVHGLQRFYAPEGYLFRTISYEHDKRHGISRFYDKGGNILKERYFWRGDLVDEKVFLEKLHFLPKGKEHS